MLVISVYSPSCVTVLSINSDVIFPFFLGMSNQVGMNDFFDQQIMCIYPTGSSAADFQWLECYVNDF